MSLKVLRDRILSDGRCLDGGILKVDRFINHQMDPYLMKQVAVEFIRRFSDLNINKIIIFISILSSCCPFSIIRTSVNRSNTTIPNLNTK